MTEAANEGGLLELDLDDFDATASGTLERAEIVIRLGRGFDPRERCQATALTDKAVGTVGLH